jgi:hypothetical protein
LPLFTIIIHQTWPFSHLYSSAIILNAVLMLILNLCLFLHSFSWHCGLLASFATNHLGQQRTCKRNAHTHSYISIPFIMETSRCAGLVTCGLSPDVAHSPPVAPCLFKMSVLILLPICVQRVCHFGSLHPVSCHWQRQNMMPHVLIWSFHSGCLMFMSANKKTFYLQPLYDVSITKFSFQGQEQRLENVGDIPLIVVEEEHPSHSTRPQQEAPQEQRPALSSAVSPIIICGHCLQMRLLNSMNFDYHPYSIITYCFHSFCLPAHFTVYDSTFCTIQIKCFIKVKIKLFPQEHLI